MGCDIHCFIEYKHKGSDSWKAHGGKIHLDRDYDLFAVMADVRNYDKMVPVAPRRGLPADVGWKVQGEDRLLITETGAGDGECTAASAARWVANGISKYAGPHDAYVTNPDWHSRSWLTPDEFVEALTRADVVNIECWAVVATLREFEQRGCEARIVFWFDN